MKPQLTAAVVEEDAVTSVKKEVKQKKKKDGKKRNAVDAPSDKLSGNYSVLHSFSSITSILADRHGESRWTIIEYYGSQFNGKQM